MTKPGKKLEELAKLSADGGYSGAMLEATDERPECLVLVVRGKYIEQIAQWIADDFRAHGEIEP